MSLQKRVSGKVEVLAKKGRPPSLNEGDLASLRKWIGDEDKASDCRTPAQLGARMAKVTQTIGTPYVLMELLPRAMCYEQRNICHPLDQLQMA